MCSFDFILFFLDLQFLPIAFLLIFLSLAAEQLGLPLIPAYSEASGDQVLHGVNYASAAAGILDITGRNFVSTSPHTIL